MFFGNRPRSDSRSPRGTTPPAASAHGAGSSSGWSYVRAFKLLSTLFPWLLVTMTGIGLVTGDLSFRGRGKFAANQTSHPEDPIRTDTMLYSSKFIIAAKRALREDRNFLADYETFCSIWNEVSPDAPLMLKMVSPAEVDPLSKKALPALSGETVEIRAENFAEMVPILDEISVLIREDGNGRGKLQNSGYKTEPAELEAGRHTESRKER